MSNISKEVNIEMLEKLEDGTFLKKNPATKADVVEETAEKQFTSAAEKQSWDAKVSAAYLSEVVKTPVPINAVFTDTRYEAGNNITIEGNIINSTGGGGADTGVSVVRLEVIGKSSFSFAYGAETIVSYNFRSSMTSIGTAQYYVDGLLRATEQIEAGVVNMDLGPYLKRGNNTIEIKVSDVYGGRGSLTYLGNGITLQLTSIFDENIAYPTDITFRYTAFGSLPKVVYIEIDGVIKHQIPVSTSGEQRTQLITSLRHGGHTIRAYSEANVDGKIIRSNELEYTVVAIDEGRTDTIIATSFKARDIDEGELVSIPYKVYTPNLTNTDVALSVNGTVINSLSVGRALQHWNTSNYPTGAVVFKIAAGGVEKSFTINIAPSELNVEAVTADMKLFLSSEGRTNADLNRAEWKYQDIEAALTGFNYTNNGWIVNDREETVLRLSGDSRVHIPFDLFAADAKSFGTTIDIEFMLRNVSDYSTDIVSCFNANVGFEISGREGKFSTQLMNDEVSKALSVNFKENEKIRLSFVVEPRSANKLIYIYLNGIVSAVYQYDINDSFKQSSPVGIDIGSSFADIDIYSIRSYDAALTANQILNNYIADTRILSEKMNLYLQNQIFDDFSNVDYGAISNQLPVLTVVGQLPIAKGTKVSSSLLFENVFDTTKGFYFEHIPGRGDKPLLDVQGTSSQYYPRKNFKMVFPEWYKLRDDSISETTFTFKADYMDSSHALNTGLARLINRVLYEVSPLPPQKEFPNIRHSIDGFPITVFHQENESSERICLGAYNFNNDKANAATFGKTALAEQWEGKDNSSARTNFTAWDVPDRDIYDDWEGRFKETDTTNLDRLGRWIVSTKNDPVKFKAEYEDYIDLDAFLSYFIIVEFFGMVDNLAKNMFLATWDGDLWYPIFYDIDTGIGLNNEGQLIFSYNIEKDDVIGSQNVWNGKDSVLWNNIAAAFPDELEAMYNRLRAAGLDYEEVTKELIGGQIDKIPAALYNYDSQYKYIDPLINDGNGTYLYIAQGSRENHIKWWLQNRIEYLDSKYKARDYQDDFIAMRLYSPSGELAVPLQPNFNITLSDDQYVAVRYGSVVQTVRGTTEEVITINAPETGTGFNDTETVIYGASKLSDIGDLAGKYVGTVDVSSASKLTKLIAGSNVPGYSNTNLTDVTVGNNRLLKEIDVRNCPNLNKVLNLRNANNIEKVYATGTSIPAVTFPDGGILKIAHLPASIVSLKVQGQRSIEDFQLASYANIKSLRIENSSGIDVANIVTNAPQLNRVRLVNADLQFATKAPLLALAAMGGLDENDNDIPTAVLTGSCHIEKISEQSLQDLRTQFPELAITYGELLFDFTVTFVDWDGAVLDAQKLVTGEYAVNPITRPINPIEEPTRAPHELYNFYFDGWESFAGAQQDLIIKAKYITDYVIVKFLDWNGTILDTQVVKYNEEIPSNPITREISPIAEPFRAPTETAAFYFTGWDKPFTTLKTHTDITATYLEKTIHVVDYLTWDDILIKREKVIDGSSGIPPAQPERAKDSLTRYEFNRWSEDLTSIKASLQVKAQYTAIDYFTITFRNWNDLFISSQEVDRGKGAVDPRDLGFSPSRPADDLVSKYVFNGWDLNIHNVQANLTAKAVYSDKAMVNLYVKGELKKSILLNPNEMFHTMVNNYSEEFDLLPGEVITGWMQYTSTGLRGAPALRTASYQDFHADVIDMPTDYYLIRDEYFTPDKQYIGPGLYVVIPLQVDGLAFTSYVGMFKDSPVLGVISRETGAISYSSMFEGSTAATLDLSKMNFNNVTSTSGMFRNSLTTEVIMPTVNNTELKYSDEMFYNSAITSFDLSGFTFEKVTHAGSMFRNSQLTEINVGHFNTSLLANMDYMFSNIIPEHVDISGWNVERMSSMRGAFSNSSLPELDFSGWVSESYVNMREAFKGSYVKNVNLLRFSTERGGSTTGDHIEMFSGFVGQSVDIKPNLYSEKMFLGANISGTVNIVGLISMNKTNQMFQGSRIGTLKAGSVSTWDSPRIFENATIGNVKFGQMNGTTYRAFAGAKIQELYVSGFSRGDNSRTEMFRDAEIPVLDVTKIDGYDLTSRNSTDMFTGLVATTITMGQYLFNRAGKTIPAGIEVIIWGNN